MKHNLQILAALALLASVTAVTKTDDVEPPEGVRERLKKYVDYSQMFFAKCVEASRKVKKVERH